MRVCVCVCKYLSIDDFFRSFYHHFDRLLLIFFFLGLFSNNGGICSGHCFELGLALASIHPRHAPNQILM